MNEKIISVESSRIDWDGAYESSNLNVGNFAGKLDELVLGNGFRDDSWNRLTYLNQRPENYWPVLKAR